MTSVTQQLKELEEMTVPQLAERFREVVGKDPRIKHKDWMRRKIAWEIQAREYGGLSKAAERRLNEIIAGLGIPFDGDKDAVLAALRRVRRPAEPTVGTVLTRRWKGQDVHVAVVEGGFEYEGVVCKSLSAAAKAITGSHWSGPAFFGLKKRSRDG